MSDNGSVVLSTLEFDVLWEAERLPERHVALDVPSPGRTHTERAQLVAAAFVGLEQRGLAHGRRAVGDLADRLNLLAYPQVSVDAWVWTDHEISALAVSTGGQAMLAVVERAEVWLIPARSTALADAAVSIAGVAPAGPGFSVSVATDLLHRADRRSRGSMQDFALLLKNDGVAPVDAKGLSLMLADMGTRGQFCVEKRGRDQQLRRAERVICFHDNPDGRYGYIEREGWSTVTPADNDHLAQWIRELLDEV